MREYVNETNIDRQETKQEKTKQNRTFAAIKYSEFVQTSTSSTFSFIFVLIHPLV